MRFHNSPDLEAVLPSNPFQFWLNRVKGLHFNLVMEEYRLPRRLLVYKPPTKFKSSPDSSSWTFRDCRKRQTWQFHAWRNMQKSIDYNLSHPRGVTRDLISSEIGRKLKPMPSPCSTLIENWISMTRKFSEKKTKAAKEAESEGRLDKSLGRYWLKFTEISIVYFKFIEIACTGNQEKLPNLDLICCVKIRQVRNWRL